MGLLYPENQNNNLCNLDETAVRDGVSTLTDRELLQLLLRIGAGSKAQQLINDIMSLARGGNGLSMLYHLDYYELISLEGIGRSKALQLLSAGEIAKRINLSARKKMPVFAGSEDIAIYYMEEMRHLETERLKLVMLDSRRQLVREKNIFSGTINKSIFEPREILIEALRSDSLYMVIIHNHPTGDPTPSSSDINSTVRIRDAGNIIGIHLLDHIIIGDNTFCSLREAGYI